MKRIHLLVLKSYIGPLFLTFFIVIFLLLMQFLWKYIDDLVGKGLETGVIIELLSYTAAGLVPLALPLAILIASLMTFGNLGENNELLAVKAAGISLQRIMSPLVYLTIVLSISAFFFANNVLPVINLHGRTLLNDIRRQSPELSIKEGIFNEIGEYTIKIEHKNPETKLLKGIKIYNHSNSKRGNIDVTAADSGYMKITDDESKLIVTLYNGTNYVETDEKAERKAPKRYPFERRHFTEQTILIKLEGFGLDRSDGKHFRKSEMMTITQLSDAQDSIIKTLEMQQIYIKQALIRDLNKNTSNLMNDSKTPNHDTLILNPDEIFEKFIFREKMTAYEKAISSARSSSQRMRNFELNIYNSKIDLRRHQMQWHEKITIAFTCFIFFFIGAPLGAIIRKGGLGTPIVVSVVFFLIYYMLSITGKKMVREDLWGVFIGMWLSSVILFISGVFLTYKATTDSVILNTETYINIVKKALRIKKRTANEDIANKQ